MGVLSELFEQVSEQQKEHVVVPYVKFDRGDDNRFRKDQVKTVRLLDEIGDWYTEVVHYVKDGPAKGYYLCGKSPVKKNYNGSEQWFFNGECALCDRHNDLKEAGDNNGKRRYRAYAKVEEKMNDDTFELKGVRLNIGDFFYTQSKGSFKDIAKVAKQYKNKITGRWLSMDETGAFVNLDPVSKDDEKRTKGASLDLSPSYVTQTVDDYLQKLGKMAFLSSHI
mgnify:FL=1